MPYKPARRWYLTADRERLVPDGDLEARFLFCIPGRSVPDLEAVKYDLPGAEQQFAAPQEVAETFLEEPSEEEAETAVGEFVPVEEEQPVVGRIVQPHRQRRKT